MVVLLICGNLAQFSILCKSYEVDVCVCLCAFIFLWALPDNKEYDMI